MNGTNPQQAIALPVRTYAGFWKRFVAYIIDKIIISFASLIIIIPCISLIGLGALNGIEEESSPGLLIAFIGAYAIVIFLITAGEWLYYAIMETKKGATLGKMAIGISVTDMAGNRISFGRATGRYFGKLLSGLILFIGYIMAGFTQQKQALHDILAGCLVVNNR